MSSASIVMVMDKLGRVLLVREKGKPLPHFWKLPGGGAKDDETPEECGSRELCEETGIQLNPKDLLFYDKRVSRVNSRHTLYMLFVICERMPEHKSFGDNNEEVFVFSITELRRMLKKRQIHPDHQRMISDILAYSIPKTKKVNSGAF